MKRTKKLKSKARKLNPKWFKKIKCLALDVDGVMTDGHIVLESIDSSGRSEWRRNFYIRDGLGLAMLRKKGYKTAIITTSNAEDIRARAKGLGIDYFFEGAMNKAEAFAELLKQSGLSADEIAFIGDDVIDLPVLREVGLSVCVADAHEDVFKEVDYVSQFCGGRGAIREICDALMKHGPI